MHTDCAIVQNVRQKLSLINLGCFRTWENSSSNGNVILVSQAESQYTKLGSALLRFVWPWSQEIPKRAGFGSLSLFLSFSTPSTFIWLWTFYIWSYLKGDQAKVDPQQPNRLLSCPLATWNMWSRHCLKKTNKCKSVACWLIASFVD